VSSARDQLDLVRAKRTLRRVPEVRRDFSQAERDRYAKSGIALPDGSYPIPDVAALKDAIAAYGRAGSKAAARAHIIKRARALGRSDLIPENWRSQRNGDGEGKGKNDMDSAEDFEQFDREKCPECEGTGSIEGERQCVNCGGIGMVNVEAPGSGGAGASEGGGVTGTALAAHDELERRRIKQEMLSGTVERRNFTSDMELRAASDGTLRLSGYASTTETPYAVNDYTETIVRGAFKRTLGENPDVVLLIEHGGLPLASTRSGTLALSEDARGLHVDATLEPSDPDVRALRPKMERGDVREMSFAFRATKDYYNKARTERTIHEVSIHRGDVSMVTRGANSSTAAEVAMRSQSSTIGERRRPPRSSRSHLDLVKAKRARLGSAKRSDAYVDGQDGDTPLGAYTELEVDALGARGEAFRKRDGSYGFVVKNRRDLLNALAAWRQLPLTSARARAEALEVKAWVKERAIHLKLEELLPANWQLKVPDTIGDSAQPDG
jgi:HK97 family phage prohead protease